jgi:hypothetical protein
MPPSRFERLQTYLQHLPEIHAAGELAAATSAVSAAFGLPTVMVGALLVRGDKVGGRFYFGNWSKEWTSVYLEKVFAEDPLVHEARRRMSPFSWSELWAEGDLPQAVRDVIEIGRQRGALLCRAGQAQTWRSLALAGGERAGTA